MACVAVIPDCESVDLYSVELLTDRSSNCLCLFVRVLKALSKESHDFFGDMYSFIYVHELQSWDHLELEL